MKFKMLVRLREATLARILFTTTNTKQFMRQTDKNSSKEARECAGEVNKRLTMLGQTDRLAQSHVGTSVVFMRLCD